MRLRNIQNAFQNQGGGSVWLEDFGQFVSNFSAPLQLFEFILFWLTLCDLCGHFEYNKPIFYDIFEVPPCIRKVTSTEKC